MTNEKNDPRRNERPEDLSLYLQEACRKDPVLNQAVETLKNGTEPPTQSPEPWSRERLIGRNIGPYRIIRELGAGGMGAVFLAEQQEPVQRQVALKFVTLSLLNQEAQERFAVEQRVLARMTHPAIAHFYECGRTEDGWPFYVMEYVDGVPITGFCDNGSLDLEQRLSLFIRVCEAISHAHLKGIVHRDIKPSNVLVTVRDGLGLPKVIDFGVAKPLRGSWDLTEEGFFHGSFRYMSPEQAGLADHEGNRIEADQRTDVYLLGILLYELLVGQPPFNWDSEASGPGIIDDICFNDPPRLGECWRGYSPEIRDDLSGKRQAMGQAWGKTLRGDLDWIVMKALEKDPDRRYRSPLDLAADLKRFLEHRPVVAGPPDIGYRWGKFLRRNRMKVVLTGLVAAVLFLSPLSFYTAKFMEQKQTAMERDRAQSALTRAERITNFLVDIFEQADPNMDGNRDISARELLDRAVINLEMEIEENPKTQVALLNILGRVYSHMDQQKAAESLLNQAVGLQGADTGSGDIAVTELELGWVRFHQGRYQEASAFFEKSLALQDAITTEPTRERARALSGLANVYFKRGLLEDARNALEKARSEGAVAWGVDHPSYGEILSDLGMVHLRLSSFEESEKFFLLAQEVFETGSNCDLPLAAIFMNNFAELKMKTGHLDEAETLYRKAIDVGKRVMDPDNYALAIFSSSLGLTYTYMGRWEDAEIRYKDALEIGRRVLGPRHPEVATFIHNIGRLHLHRLDTDQAETHLMDALGIIVEKLGRDHHRHAMVLNSLGMLYLKTGELDRAEGVFTRALDIYERALGPEHYRSALTRMCLGRLESARFNDAPAMVHFKKAAAVLKAKLRSNHPHQGRIHYYMARHHHRQGRLEEAMDLCNRALEVRSRILSAEHPEMVENQKFCNLLSAS